MSTIETNSPGLQTRPICESIADSLIERIGHERFEMWFGQRESIQLDADEIHSNHARSVLVIAENTFSLNRIKTVFGSELRTIVDQICGPQCEIGYKLARSKTKSGGQNPAGSPDKGTRHDRLGSVQTLLPLEGVASPQPIGCANEPSGGESSASPENSRPVSANSAAVAPAKPVRTLKSFWFGDENRLAEASVAQLLEQPGQFTPLFIYGSTGSGKTHLLEAIVYEYRHRLRQKRCVMLSAEQFTSLFVSSLKGGDGLPMFRRKYRDLDLLAVDDIQFLAGKKATINEFYHTLETLVRAGKQVVLTADRPAIELGLLGGDLGNRLNAGLTCPLRYPGAAGRVEIANRLCKERKIKLSANVIEHLGKRLTGDVRRLSGALNRLHAYRMSGAETITVEVAENILSDLFTEFQTNHISLNRIETAICELCGLKPAQLKSSSRQKTISTARMLAMYLSREYTSVPFSEIGNYFGGRSHSTVIAAQKQVNKWLAQNQGITLPHATYRAQEVLGRLKSNLRIG